MFFCWVVAIFATLFYLNTLFTEHLISRMDVYGNDKDDKADEIRSRTKLVCIIVMALFWAAIIIS